MSEQLTTEADPTVAMARDAAMLASAEAGTSAIRLYRWADVCVTLGRHQRPEEALVDPAVTPWARRPTGGSAVLHGHDVTLTVATPWRPGSRSVRDLYRRLAQAPIMLLAAWGVSADLAENIVSVTGRATGPYCFATTSACDVVGNDGHKLCGCALHVTRHAALLQTSIPISQPTVEPSSVIFGGEPLPILAVAPLEIDLDAVLARIAVATA